MNPPETLTAPATKSSAGVAGVIVNDLSITAATANGTGSQSANNILTKTLFRMGPVHFSGSYLTEKGSAGEFKVVSFALSFGHN